MSPTSQHYRANALPTNDNSSLPNPIGSISNTPRQQSHMSSSPDSRRRMRNVLLSLSSLARETRETADAQIPRDASFSDERSLVHPGSARPRVQPDSRFRRSQPERPETWLQSRSETTDFSAGSPLTNLHEAGERLARVNEDARNLLNRPLYDSNPHDGLQISSDGQHRRKRRRTRTKSSFNEYPVINYGHYGQVVPGKLHMELISTDGGIMEPYRQQHSPENVLKDDSSVYCTQSPRCNIVLRHRGGTTFSLSKLVIKAPKSGFTDPSVREGVVFVAMKRDDVFERTMRYRIYHLPTNRLAPSLNSRHSRQDTPVEDPYGLPLGPQRLTASSFDDQASGSLATVASANARAMVNADADSAGDSSEASDGGTDPAHTSSEPTQLDSSHDSDDELDREEVLDSGTPGTSGSSSTPHRNPHDHWIRIWNEREAGSRRYRPPIWAQRFRPRWFRSPGSSDYQDMLQQFDFDEVLRRGETASADRRSRRQALQARADQQAQRQEAGASTTTSRENNSSHPEINPPSSRLPLDLLTPAVRFSVQSPFSDEDDEDDLFDAESDHDQDATTNDHVEQHSSGNVDGLGQMRTCTTTSNKLTIKFDPPLSGKYILLKLWSPRERGNIDIERICAYGFAGVRWFPSVEMR